MCGYSIEGTRCADIAAHGEYKMHLLSLFFCFWVEFQSASNIDLRSGCLAIGMLDARVKQCAKCIGYEPLRHTVENLAAHGVQHSCGTRCPDIPFDPRSCMVIKHYKIEQDKCGTRCATQLWHTGHICIFRSKGSLSWTALLSLSFDSICLLPL